MILQYNGIDLGSLGVLRILGTDTQREPVEAPQRERVRIKFRLDFFQNNYGDNAGLIEQVRAAFKTQQAQCLWQDGNGTDYLNRTVTVGEDDEPEDGRKLSGTTQQALTFTLWYYNHDLVTNCLKGAYGGLDMGAVTGWTEGYDARYFDPMRDARERVEGTLSCMGRYQADTTKDLTTRRAALLATKDAMNAALLSSRANTFTYGTFNQSVRVTKFEAKVDDAMNFIDWSLSATFTRYPNEANYLILEYKVGHKVKLEDGIDHLTISGKIRTTTLAIAQAQLALLAGAIVPTTYIQEDSDQVASYYQSASAATGTTLTGSTGDGLIFTEVAFTLEYRDVATLKLTYQRTGSGTALIDLGTVEGFSDKYSGELFDPMRDQRKRGGGMVTARGFISQPDSATLASKQAAFAAKYKTIMTELVAGSSGTLIYGTPSAPLFTQRIRVVECPVDLDRAQNKIRWALTGSYTKFPDESDYAMCEFKTATHEDKVNGTVKFILSGKIGAPTEDAADAKLVALRNAVVPSGFVLLDDETTASNVSVASGSGGDGQTFIELSFNDTYQKVDGAISTWSLRISTDDDLKSGWVRTTYSGSVQAYAGTSADAYTAAAAQAATLGDGKGDFQIRSEITENERLFLTSGGQQWVTVDFTYEYQDRGDRIFLEVKSELSKETFGRNTETVSGYVAAATLALAQSTYAANVRNIAAYNGALILNERTPTIDQQRAFNGDGTNEVDQDDRFTFSFQVHRDKASGDTALRYELTSKSNIQANKLIVTAKGTVYAADEVTAQAALTSYLEGLDLGTLIESETSTHIETGPSVSGSGEVAFVAMDFSNTYSGVLAFNGVLETRITEEVQYSGTRWVIKPIPDSTVVVQNCGVMEGGRTISVMAKGTTEAACRAYVAGVAAAMVTGPYPKPPRIKSDFEFVEQVQGVARGTGVNVMLFVVEGSFAEILPAIGYTG